MLCLHTLYRPKHHLVPDGMHDVLSVVFLQTAVASSGVVFSWGAIIIRLRLLKIVKLGPEIQHLVTSCMEVLSIYL